MNTQQRAAMQMALEALEVSTDWDVGARGKQLQSMKAITALREALSEQAEQEPLMDYERINALREGEQNGAEDAYFFVRPENDTPSLRKMFCQGFERGFHKGLKYAAPVQQIDLTDDEIQKWIDVLMYDPPEWALKRFARAVIAAYKEKNK